MSDKRWRGRRGESGRPSQLTAICKEAGLTPEVLIEGVMTLGGSATAAAAILGVNGRTFMDWLDKYWPGRVEWGYQRRAAL